MDKIKVGLCGLGTVGTGVVRVLADHKERIIHKLGCEVEITKILVNDVLKERDVIIDREWLTDKPEELVKDKDIDVIVEVMGGVDGTKELLEEALKNKKHIVTANKDLMALHGR